MPREEVRTKASGKEAKRCDVCGCRTWLHDGMTGEFHGPYHFQECATVPGGAELAKLNALDRVRWQGEKPVPRAQGSRILKTIMLMMNAPSRAVMLETKAAILHELEVLVKEG